MLVRIGDHLLCNCVSVYPCIVYQVTYLRPNYVMVFYYPLRLQWVPHQQWQLQPDLCEWDSWVPLWMWKWPNSTPRWTHLCCKCTMQWQYCGELHMHMPPWLPRYGWYWIHLHWSVTEFCIFAFYKTLNGVQLF